jgi:hypothetical protein
MKDTIMGWLFVDNNIIFIASSRLPGKEDNDVIIHVSWGVVGRQDGIKQVIIIYRVIGEPACAARTPESHILLINLGLQYSTVPNAGMRVFILHADDGMAR